MVPPHLEDAGAMKNPIAQLMAGGARHRAALFSALVLVGALAALAVIFNGHFTNDVSRLFPDTRETRATFDILHNSHLSDTVQLEFVCRDDVTKHEKYLDDTAARLEKSPFVKQLTFRYRSDDLDAELAGFSRLVPRFFTPDLLDECDPDAAVKNALKQLSSPAPGVARRLRTQPFGWELKLLNELKKLDDATGMKLAAELPYFASADRKRAMIVVETGVRLGDADAVRKLFSELRSCAAPLPDGVEMRIISGCSHTLGNEEVLKRDAMIAGAVSLALFLALFVWFYRGDRRALWIPIVPLYASLVSLAVMTFFFREICLYVIGLGGCITGLAVDQGIHVYAAFRGADAERRTAALAEPMWLSAATSVAVFVFLAFTGIAAYIQLAVFAGLSLIFSALLALLVLPHLLDREHELRRVFSARPVERRRGWAFLAVVVLVAAAGIVLPQLVKRADFALDSLDGTPRKTLDEEKEFRAAWHSPKADTAVLAAGGETGEAALEHLETVTAELARRGVQVAMPPRPPLRKQMANREKWRAPEVAEKIDGLEAGCRAACRRRGLPEKFFAPFFAQLRENIASDDLTLPSILRHIDRKMIKSHGESAAAVALLPDTLENASAVRTVLRERGEDRAALLSKNGFKLLVREELGGRFEWLLPLSVLAALAMLFAVFRKVGDVLLAMVPVAVGFSGVALVMYLTRFRATPAAAFALVLLTGLAVDYGIYAVSQLRHPGELDTRDPILLSAATTVAGAGALLTSRHPALFGTGVVLAPGIALACLAGVFLVPMLKTTKLPKKSVPLLLSAATLLLCGAGCGMMLWRDYPAKDETLRRMRLPYPETAFKVQALTTASFGGGRTFRFVLAAKIAPPSGEVTLAGVDPGSGVLLFKHDGRPESRPFISPVLAADAPPQLVEFLEGLPENLRNIFISKDGLPRTVGEDDDYIMVFCDGDTYWKLYHDGKRMKRGCIHWIFPDWEAEYDKDGREVIYRRFDGSMKRRKYALFLKIDEMKQVKK